MRGKFYRFMGSELTPMFTIAVLVRANLDIDVLRHLRHHWRLPMSLSMFPNTIHRRLLYQRRLCQRRFHQRRPRYRFYRYLHCRLHHLVSSW